jgi:formamidopyrimidine-DNA glycosylase
MYRTFFPYRYNRKVMQYDMEGMNCPQCGELLDLISDVSREIFLCPTCGYYHETVPYDEEI